MTTRTEIVSKNDLIKSKSRTSKNHLDGFVPIHTDKLNDETFKITWNNDPKIIPPRRKLTQRELLEEIANERNMDLI